MKIKGTYAVTNTNVCIEMEDGRMFYINIGERYIDVGEAVSYEEAPSFYEGIKRVGP